MSKITSSAVGRNRPKSNKLITLNRLLNLTYFCVGLAIILIALQFALYGMRYRGLFDDSTYQAVTLTNGLTFFGRLQRYSPNTFVLSDVYYLKTSADVNELNETAAASETAAEATTDSGLQLFQLSQDFYQPQNDLIINRDQIVYWQNLQSDSPIVQTIVNQ